MFLLLRVSTENIFLSFLCSSTIEWKLNFCGVLEIHVIDRFWKAEDTEPQPHFRKFLDMLKDENDGGWKMVLKWLKDSQWWRLYNWPDGVLVESSPLVSNSSARQILCSFYLPKFLFSSTITNTTVCRALGTTLCLRSYARKCHDSRNAKTCPLGSSLAARLSWYNTAHQHLSPSLPRKGWCSRKVQHQELQIRNDAAAQWRQGSTRHRASIKEESTHRSEQINLMLFSSILPSYCLPGPCFSLLLLQVLISPFPHAP